MERNDSTLITETNSINDIENNKDFQETNLNSEFTIDLGEDLKHFLKHKLSCKA